MELYEKIKKDDPIYKESLADSLKDLLNAMLNKNSQERITIERIKLHSWVTRAGTRPLPSREENCFGDTLNVTSEEIEEVFKPVTFVHRMMNIFGLKSRASLIPRTSVN